MLQRHSRIVHRGTVNAITAQRARLIIPQRPAKMSNSMTMKPIFRTICADLSKRASAMGIKVSEKRLDPDTPGLFDGSSITINPLYDNEEEAYYLAHTVGTIAKWSVDNEASKSAFQELWAAKQTQDRPRLEKAVAAWREFEESASGYAVWLLDNIGYHDVIPGYIKFARADLDRMTVFHLTGEIPAWKEFRKQWNEQVERGEKKIDRFRAEPLPRFKPLPMPVEQILQNRE